MMGPNGFLLDWGYQKLLKPVLFRLDAEKVHEGAMKLAEAAGEQEWLKDAITCGFGKRWPALEQEILGIKFAGPVGLAAGFDYEARLTQILPALGFGFQTVGTITSKSYEGNPQPRLKRLPRSQALLVNKGFKNLGAERTIDNLRGLNNSIPLGISIGRTNSRELVSQKESVADIVSAFRRFEEANISNSYYELNISCPNLFGSVSFYPKKNLDELLSEIDGLRIRKPILVKMPIAESTADFLKMTEVIVGHSPKGIIVGNLAHERTGLDGEEKRVIERLPGGISGRPTFERSNELIKLASKNFGRKLVIVGCGGIFSTGDAYAKILAGASLVQLITGLIYQGPQLVAEINAGLVELLEKDGLKNISQVVGADFSLEQSGTRVYS